MIKNKYRGQFIVFEGLDGSGQSTQVELLANFLEKKGKEVLKTKEPTKDSKAGKIIEKVLAEKKKISPLKLQKLFSRDRKHHLKKIIIPALKNGKIVISDRYFFSSFSYGKSDGLKLKKLYGLNRKFLKPDIVFFIDTSPEVSIGRVESRGKEKTLFEKLGKLKEVYQNYKEILEDYSQENKVYFIKGERSISQISEDIKSLVEKF